MPQEHGCEYKEKTGGIGGTGGMHMRCNNLGCTTTSVDGGTFGVYIKRLFPGLALRASSRQTKTPDPAALQRLEEVAEVDYAYIAGFFDGEGCIKISDPGNGWLYLEIGITQTRLDVLNWTRKLLGGCISYTAPEKQAPKKDGSYRRARYEWHASGWLANAVIGKLLPYLKVKHIEAHAARQFWEYSVAYKQTRNPALLKEMLDIRMRLRDLKKNV